MRKLENPHFLRVVATAFLLLAACAVMPFSRAKSAREESQKGRTVTGVIVQSWSDSTGRRYEKGLSVPTRLCSVDRVFQAQPDSLGRFTFLNVPPGEYELSTGQLVRPPRTIKGIEVEPGASQLVFVRMEFNDPRIMKIEDADCFRDTLAPRVMDCDRSWFSIDYGPWSAGRSALIKGRVTDAGSRRSARGLAQAQVTLRKHGNPTFHYAAVTDKHGAFEIAPPAGIYDLTASVVGFENIKINGFLVPKENDTKISLRTSGTNAIMLCE